MNGNQNYEQIAQKFNLWLHERFLTPDTLIQLAILVVSFLIAAAIYQLIKGRIARAIEASELPARIRRTVNNLYRLITPIGTLMLIFVLTRIAQGEFGINTVINDAAMKLLLAWIIITIALQFVTSNNIRNLLTWTILIIAALSIFGILDETTHALDAIGFNFGDIRFSALALIKGAISLFLLLYIALFISTFVERRILQSKSLTRSSQVMVVKITRIVLVVFAILIGVNSAGLDLSVFTVFLGTIGLGIGFGMQKVASNLFSGMLLLMDKSIAPGDIIELEKTGTYGWVNHMAARYTEVVTRDNKSYLIPNEDFITQRVINWSHGNRLIRLDVKFSVRAGADPRQVIDIAMAAAKKPARVVDTPEPACAITEFGENGIAFSLYFWIKDAEGGVSNIKGEVLLSIWDALLEAKIPVGNIPGKPQYSAI